MKRRCAELRLRFDGPAEHVERRDLAVYGVAGELTSFNGDTRTYNSLFELTRINAGTSMDIEYNYTAGRITEESRLRWTM